MVEADGMEWRVCGGSSFWSLGLIDVLSDPSTPSIPSILSILFK